LSVDCEIEYEVEDEQNAVNLVILSPDELEDMLDDEIEQLEPLRILLFRQT
jgi:hypothetical protein